MTLRPNKENRADSEPGLSGPRELAQALGRFLRAQVWLLVGLLLGVIALELGLRSLRPDLVGLSYGPIRTGGHVIAFSEKSFRVPEGQTTEDVPVILALGDSTTFGTGVAAEQTWPLRLGDQLSEDIPVANAGFPGGGLRQFSQSLDTLWAEPVPPKIVLLLVTGNMISFTEFRGEDVVHDPLRRVRAAKRHAAAEPGFKERAVQTLQSSALWKALSNNIEILKYALGLSNHRTNPKDPLSPLLAYGWQQPDLPEDYDARMWSTFGMALEDLVAVTRAQNACLVVGFLPPRFMLSSKRADNLKFVPKSRLDTDAPTRVNKMAEDLGVPFLDMTVPLQNARGDRPPRAAPFYIPNDYTHLSAAGHEVVAQAFSAFLKTDADCARVE